jgi:ribosomal protein L11
MALIPVNTIEVKEDESIEFNIASTEANDDWIRAARLAQSSSKKDKKKLAKMDAVQMQIRTD